MRCAGATVTLPRLGMVATHESTRKLARRIENGSARILSATVSRTAQRWHVSFTCEVERAPGPRTVGLAARSGSTSGWSILVTGVDDAGETVIVAGPKALRSSLRKLRRASKAHSRKAKSGANRRKAAARLARVHARIANVRADALHKATTELARRYETVVCEDLNVSGMSRNRRFARAIADQGFGAYAADARVQDAWHGGRLIVTGRWYPSSKTCSSCGTVKAKLSLSERTYRCGHCGLTMDRDVNAASNLIKLAASGAESLNACGGTVGPGTAGHDPVMQEPGTAPAGKTGTAANRRPQARSSLGLTDPETTSN